MFKDANWYNIEYVPTFTHRKCVQMFNKPHNILSPLATLITSEFRLNYDLIPRWYCFETLETDCCNWNGSLSGETHSLQRPLLSDYTQTHQPKYHIAEYIADKLYFTLNPRI